MLDTEVIEFATPQGRKVVAWRSTMTPAAEAPVVIIMSGFTQTMRRAGPLALALAGNGAIVYRYDPLDHCGASHGEILNFHFDSALSSFETLLTSVLAREAVTQIDILSISLSTPVALKFAVARPAAIHRIATLVGVIDIPATLLVALGVDYAAPSAELPPKAAFEHHLIDPRRIHAELNGGGWDPASIAAALAALPAPVTAFVASADQWVPRDQYEHALAQEQAGPRALVEVPDGSHEIRRNPTLFRELTSAIVRSLLQPDAEATLPLYEPSIREVLQLTASERRLANDLPEIV